MVLTMYTRPDNGLTLLNEVWVPAPPVLVDDELTIGSVKELSSIMSQTLERNPRTLPSVQRGPRGSQTSSSKTSNATHADSGT